MGSDHESSARRSHRRTKQGREAAPVRSGAGAGDEGSAAGPQTQLFFEATGARANAQQQ